MTLCVLLLFLLQAVELGLPGGVLGNALPFLLLQFVHHLCVLSSFLLAELLECDLEVSLCLSSSLKFLLKVIPLFAEQLSQLFIALLQSLII